jgi:NAD(P)-dependent dehydrogenase (short-subunit alcohol dehydrogenase family)
MDQDLLSGQSIVVTGGGQGIGLGIVQTLVEHGARLVVNDLVEDRAAAAAAEVERSGGSAVPVGGDVSDPGDARRIVTAAVEAYGRVDTLVNNAGALCNKSFFDHTVEEWDRVFAVNMRGIFLLGREVLPAMMERRSGSIVNIASISAFNTTREHVAYAASKAGVVTLTRDLATEVAGFGMENGIVLLTTIPAGEPVGVYGRESWVSV